MKKQKAPKKIEQIKRPVGRPSGYRPEYCEQIIRFFDRTPYEYNSALKKNVPCDLPLFEAFAISIGVHRATVLEWADRFPEFNDAIKKAKDLQKNILVINAMRGHYNTVFAIFTAKNITDMRDRIDGEIQHNAGGALERYMDAFLKVGTNGTDTGNASDKERP